MISAMTASTPYWGRPISVVIEMALAETALELSTVLVVVALVVIIVLEVILVSKIHPANQYKLILHKCVGL